LTLPDSNACLRILEDEGCEEKVIEHSKLVEAVAVAFAEAINEKHTEVVNVRLVSTGALLHDLGRARTHDLGHVVVGVEMAEEKDIDPRVVEIIRRHVGGGLTKTDAVDLGLPEWDMIPQTLEEKIVCHADTLVGSTSRRTLKQTLKRIRKKGSPMYERRVRELHRQLSGLAEQDLDTIGPWTLPRKSRLSRDTGATRFFKDI
jgi:uncharacterized protein (TIGR00295 family)